MISIVSVLADCDFNQAMQYVGIAMVVIGIICLLLEIRYRSRKIVSATGTWTALSGAFMSGIGTGEGALQGGLALGCIITMMVMAMCLVASLLEYTDRNF